MNPVSDTDRRLSVLHIFKIYYPDLFGGTLSVIRDVCIGHVCGRGADGYRDALARLREELAP